MKRTPLLRRTPLRSLALPRHGRTKLGKGIPLATRHAVKERSGGLCECGCGRVANHIHHRKLRSAGGDHSLPNLLHLSHGCHRWAHDNPAAAMGRGLIVAGHDNPADVFVIPDAT